MWLSSMCTMSSARESKCSPQPPNLQALEKKEAAAIPLMVAAALVGWRNEEGKKVAAVAAAGWRWW